MLFRSTLFPYTTLFRSSEAHQGLFFRLGSRIDGKVDAAVPILGQIGNRLLRIGGYILQFGMPRVEQLRGLAVAVVTRPCVVNVIADGDSARRFRIPESSGRLLVNLWDRNSGYGKEGMPAVNTTSYPKLIKALREALGTEKLLTVTVYEEPTWTVRRLTMLPTVPYHATVVPRATFFRMM